VKGQHEQQLQVSSGWRSRFVQALPMMLSPSAVLRGASLSLAWGTRRSSRMRCVQMSSGVSANGQGGSKLWQWFATHWPCALPLCQILSPQLDTRHMPASTAGKLASTLASTRYRLLALTRVAH